MEVLTRYFCTVGFWMPHSHVQLRVISDAFVNGPYVGFSGCTNNKIIDIGVGLLHTCM